MKSIKVLGLLMLALFAIAADPGGCDHVNELAGAQLDPDRPVDKFALSYGAVVAACTYLGHHVSGAHYNPAVPPPPR